MEAAAADPAPAAAAGADDPRPVARDILAQAIAPKDAAVARRLESGIYNYAVRYASSRGTVLNWRNPRFRAIYMSKLRSLSANLMESSYVGNTRFVSRLLEHEEFQPQEAAFMDASHVYPELWKEVLDAKQMRDRYIEKPEAMTDQYRCGRCKKRECVYQELQVRSSDEPMSLFITCLNCGNRWRMG